MKRLLLAIEGIPFLSVGPSDDDGDLANQLMNALHRLPVLFESSVETLCAQYLRVEQQCTVCQEWRQSLHADSYCLSCDLQGVRG